MTTKQTIDALLESVRIHTQLRDIAKRKGDLEVVALEQATIDGIIRTMNEYARKLRK